MCMAIDAAVYVSNKIIDIYESEKKECQVEFFKIHKLLYVAQGIMLSVYGYPMFEEEISAHKCGVYINGLDTFYEIVGSEVITDKITKYSPLLTYDRKKVLDYVANKYGKITTKDLIDNSKKHEIYIEAFKQTQDNQPKPIISKNKIKNYFCTHKEELFNDF